MSLGCKIPGGIQLATCRFPLGLTARQVACPANSHGVSTVLGCVCDKAGAKRMVMDEAALKDSRRAAVIYSHFLVCSGRSVQNVLEA